jgi:hypothetical protein
MKLTAKTDLEVPADAVYASLMDHQTWEREAVRRGVGVERPSDMPLAGVGAGWRIKARYRGKMRNVLVRINSLTPGQSADFAIEGQSVDGNVVFDVLALSPRRSRLRVSIDIRPKTLAARLFLNTLRLAKGRVQARLETRLGKLGQHLKDRHQRNQVRT